MKLDIPNNQINEILWMLDKYADMGHSVDCDEIIRNIENQRTNER